MPEQVPDDLLPPPMKLIEGYCVFMVNERSIRW